MSDTLYIGAIAAVVLIVLMTVFYGTAKVQQREATDWQAFVYRNDCRIVEVMDGETNTSLEPIIGFDGKMSLGVRSSSSSAQECWLCNDGRRYWKRAGLAREGAKE